MKGSVSRERIKEGGREEGEEREKRYEGGAVGVRREREVSRELIFEERKELEGTHG